MRSVLLCLLSASSAFAQSWAPVPLPEPPPGTEETCHPSAGPYAGLFTTARGVVLGSSCGTHLRTQETWQRLGPASPVDLHADASGGLYARWLAGSDTHDSAGPFRLDEAAAEWVPFREGLPAVDAPSGPYVIALAIDADDVAWTVLAFSDTTVAPTLYRRPVGDAAWSPVPASAHPDGFPPIWLHRLRTGAVVGTSLRSDPADPDRWRVLLHRPAVGQWPAVEVGTIPDAQRWLPLVGLGAGADTVVVVNGYGTSTDGPGAVFACAADACNRRPDRPEGMLQGMADADGLLITGRWIGGGPSLAVTADAGQTWEPLDPPADVLGIGSVVAGPDGQLYVHDLRAALTHGLWMRPLPVGTAVDEPHTSPPDIALSVTPNPTRGPASVGVRLTRSGEVRVDVYDLLGRRVARLHDGPLGSGEQHLSLPALPAGVYVVGVRTAGLIEAVRVVVAE